MENPESGGLLLVFGAGRQEGGRRWLVRHTGSAMACSVVESSGEFAHYWAGLASAARRYWAAARRRSTAAVRPWSAALLRRWGHVRRRLKCRPSGGARGFGCGVSVEAAAARWAVSSPRLLAASSPRDDDARPPGEQSALPFYIHGVRERVPSIAGYFHTR